ncbi:(2,3-dihydroxybenzoyl)adenylate synthase [Larsenimonas rhizosphaerae]|uniref:Long-chain-fatty-acid--CoA ligase n=1 Tax=Larsenimonas rhizosphaerae TaxID=2944682 RepID=A0AA41ZFS5_9GAMM|nr:AMP-binding protein [Larsenimonas rhizosphaerae]MCX2524492.1 AMP-binding protein [Larsenimonas rhizosphaerae]
MNTSSPLIAADLDTIYQKSPDYPEDAKARYRDAGLWTDMTLGNFLREGARRFATRPAIVEGGTRWSYKALDHEVDRLSFGLQSLGLLKGDRVVLQLANRASMIMTTLACFRLGLLPVFALPAHRSHELIHFCTASGARALITMADQVAGQPDVDFRALARRVIRACPGLEHVLIDGTPEEFTSLDSLYQDTPAVADWPAVTADELAFFQLSGGTTGLSKLIPRRHQDYLYSIRGSIEPCGINEHTVYLGALPLAHNFPMSSPGFLGVLYAGGCVVMAPAPTPDHCFPLIEAEGVTHASLVPPLALLWLNSLPQYAHLDLSSLQVLQVGGARFSAEAARRVRPELGCTLQQVFGMAEGLVNYTRLDDDPETIVRTQGRPISRLDEVRIVDAAGRPVPDGTPGLLETRGPYTIRGYFDAPAHNEASFTDEGFYRTGDVVSRTSTGYLIVEGRDKDQINRGGEKISPEEVENLLLAHPEVHDVAVVGMTDAYLGERPCAFIVPRGDATPKAGELAQYLKDTGLATYKVPDRFRIVEAFPETRVGKVSRKVLREQLKDTYATPHASA